MTAVPDHRHGRVVLACACGVTLELPPRAAEAAKPRWEAIHAGAGHAPVDAETARQAAASSTFEGFIAASERAGRS